MDDYFIKNWKCYSLEDMGDLRKERKYIVTNLIPQPSLSIFYGQPGSMKSILIADMFCSIANGELWLPPHEEITAVNGFETKKCKAMWFDFDNGYDETVERFDATSRMHNIKYKQNIEFCTMPGILDFSKDIDFERFEALVQFKKAEIICVDNLKVTSGKIKENSDEMAIVMNNWRKLAERNNLSIIIIHHQRKGTADNKNNTGESLRGSSTINAAIDLAMQVTRNANDKVTVTATKSRGAKVEPFKAAFQFTHRENTKTLDTAMFYGEDALKEESDEVVKNAIIEFSKITAKTNVSEIKKFIKEKKPSYGVNRVGDKIKELLKEKKLREVAGDKNLHVIVPV